MGDGAVIFVLDPKGSGGAVVETMATMAMVLVFRVVIFLMLGVVFVVDIVVLAVFIPFFFGNDPKVKVKGGSAVVVILDAKGAGGASFPMVGIT